MKDNQLVKFFLNTFIGIRLIVDGFVGMFVDIATNFMLKITVVCAPIPPAFAVFTAMMDSLHTPFYIALLAAFAIEAVGMFSAKTSLLCYQWETTKSKSEESIPLKISLLMTGVFFLVTFVLSISIEIWDGARILIYPGFVLSAVSVYVNQAIYTKLKSLLDAKEALLAERSVKNKISAEIRKLNTTKTKAQDALKTTVAKVKANEAKLKDFESLLDDRAKTRLQEMAAEIESLKKALSEQQKAHVLLEAVQIVDHHVTNGAYKAKIQEFEGNGNELLSGIVKDIAQMIVNQNGKKTTLDTIAKELNLSRDEITAALGAYKGMKFVKIGDKYYAEPKELVA